MSGTRQVCRRIGLTDSNTMRLHSAHANPVTPRTPTTTPVVIFGAGDAGRRALALVQRDPSMRAVAFADNAPGRQGAEFEGLPIVAPAAITSMPAGRVVVASMAWRAIVRQLHGLGVPANRVDVYSVEADTIGPPFPPGYCPTVLVLTDECISPSHGTGAVLLRHFATYPRERLMHGYLAVKGDSFLPHSFKVAPAAEIAGAAATSRGGNTALSARELVAKLEAVHGPIEIVYSNFLGETGLTFLSELIDVLGPAVPVIHHVHDLIVKDDACYEALLASIAPRVSEFWAIGPGLADRVAQATKREVALMNTFSCRISPAFKQHYGDVDATFTAVMLGNSHLFHVLEGVRDAWAEVRRRHGVGPIRWFAYPTSVLNVEGAGVRIDPHIEYYGFLSDRILHEHLLAADLAIVPFNVTEDPEHDYARYSIPSRLTEFMNAGLPVFAAAGRNTEARRFIEHHGIGRCSTLADTRQFTRDLLDVVGSTATRRTLGTAARGYAERHCDVERYRARLLCRIGALTGFNLDHLVSSDGGNDGSRPSAGRQPEESHA